MVDFNPYAAPETKAAPEPPGDVLALRERYLYRETTLRAMAVANLLLAGGAAVALFVRYPGAEALVLAIIAGFCLYLAVGLWRLSRGAMMLQALTSAAILVIGLVACAEAVESPLRLVPGLYLIVLHSGVIHVTMSQPSRAVVRREYRRAVATIGTVGSAEAVAVKSVLWTVAGLLSLLSLWVLLT